MCTLQKYYCLYCMYYSQIWSHNYVDSQQDLLLAFVNWMHYIALNAFCDCRIPPF